MGASRAREGARRGERVCGLTGRLRGAGGRCRCTRGLATAAPVREGNGGARSRARDTWGESLPEEAGRGEVGGSGAGEPREPRRQVRLADGGRGRRARGV